MVDRKKFAEEDAAGYKLTFIGRGVQVTEAMKNYFNDKFSKIERFHDHIMDVHVTMEIHREEQCVSIVIKLEHFFIKVSATCSDIYASIDHAIERLHEKMRRWRSRIQDHTAKKLSVVDMQVNVLRRPYNLLEEVNGEIEAETRKEKEKIFHIPKVIANDKMPLKTITTNEAIMKMELSDDPFLIFVGEEDRKLKVIYRRQDGDYGIVLPQ